MTTQNGLVEFKKTFVSGDLNTGGLLLPAQAKRFISMYRIQPTIGQKARIHSMKSPNEEVPRIGFGGRIFHKGTENTAPSSEAKPTTTKIELSSKEFVAEVPMTYNMLEDNIERAAKLGQVHGGQIQNTIIDLIMGQAALDIEEFALKSDTASLDTDLTQFDGWLKIGEANNVYDHAGEQLNKSAFFNTLLMLPDANQNLHDLFYVTPIKMYRHWQDEAANHVSAHGNEVLFGNRKVQSAYNYPILPCGNMPSTDGDNSDEGKILITHPSNLVIGIYRQIHIDYEKSARERKITFVVSFRMDAKFEQPEGVAVGKGVKIA